MLDGLGFRRMKSAVIVKDLRVKKSGGDFIVTGYL
jgi:hypothetical protein